MRLIKIKMNSLKEEIVMTVIVNKILMIIIMIVNFLLHKIKKTAKLIIQPLEISNTLMINLNSKKKIIKFIKINLPKPILK